ncbi:hypothetical protein C8F04DRAFT_1180803 [Mycena alexandri]|uniref:Uncharacterized protein n=1 Tax=Mycena alexandri TaxID=1745969 RepID=A0AAD6T0H0_9AGAR|nr:hypothetical protein C8F04DRAFT_1180803 [Mycena alexandri]
MYTCNVNNHEVLVWASETGFRQTQKANTAAATKCQTCYRIPGTKNYLPGTHSEEPSVSNREHSHDPHSPGSDNETWDFDLGDELPDLDCDSDDERNERNEMDDQVVAASEITEESELKKFATFLSDAQEAARVQERAQQTKRPKRYRGDSTKTKYRRRKLGKEMEAQGFLNVFEYMKKKKPPKEPEVVVQPAGGDNSSDPAGENEKLYMSYLQELEEDEQEVQDTEEHSTQELSDDEPDDEPEVQNSDGEGNAQAQPADAMDPVNLAHVRLRELLEAIEDPSPETGADRVLNQLNYTHFAALRPMVGTLNLYLDSELSYTWREASMIVAKSQGHGSYRARSIRSWIHAFLIAKKLPLHRYGQYHSSILNDEDFADAIKLHLQSVTQKDGHFKAQDLVDFVASQEMQELLDEAGIHKRSISVWTARRWLKRLDWCYGHRKNGMYIDGHEREDVVAYCAAFVKRWLEEYEPRMVSYDNDGNPVKNLEGYVLTGKYKETLLGNHSELSWSPMMNQHFMHMIGGKLDGRTNQQKANQNQRGKGNPSWEARLLFRAGKNRDGWFASDDVMIEAERAIDIFEAKTNRLAAPEESSQCTFCLQNGQAPQRGLDPPPQWTPDAPWAFVKW